VTSQFYPEILCSDLLICEKTFLDIGNVICRALFLLWPKFFNVLKYKENQLAVRFGIFFALFMCYNSYNSVKSNRSF